MKRAKTFEELEADMLAAVGPELLREYTWRVRAQGFHLSPEQWARVKAWKAEVTPRAIALLQERYEDVPEDERPCSTYSVPLVNGTEEAYYGAIGGGWTYIFLPTSVGTICTVKEAYTGEELVLDEDFG